MGWGTMPGSSPEQLRIEELERRNARLEGLVRAIWERTDIQVYKGHIAVGDGYLRDPWPPFEADDVELIHELGLT